jgi:hypothetical protein
MRSGLDRVKITRTAVLKDDYNLAYGKPCVKQKRLSSGDF